VAKQQTTEGAADLVTAYKSFFFDLPLASLKWSLGAGEEKEATVAAWTGYDAGVRAASTAIDALYQNPIFSETFSRMLSAALRWQQLGNSLSGAVLTSLWRTLGVPTSAEVHGLSEQVRTLETRLAQVAQKKDVQALLDQLRTLDTRLPRPTPTPLRAHHEERVAA
jgi:hypothetical protein